MALPLHLGLLKTASLSILLSAVYQQGEPPSLRALRQLHRPIQSQRKAPPSSLTQSSPSQPIDLAVPTGFSLFTYHSAGQQLRAWIGRPLIPGPHPAVLLAHAGFAVSHESLQLGVRLVALGYIVIVPAWRAENGNPGAFELCYGEVDDAVAALKVLGEDRAVDKTRIYVIGIRTGATIAALLAEMSDLPHGVACIGGCLDLENWAESTVLPFDKNNQEEIRLRSPARFAQSVRVPVTLYYADEDGSYIIQAKRMELSAKANTKPVSVVIWPGEPHAKAIETHLQEVMDKLAGHQYRKTGPPGT